MSRVCLALDQPRVISSKGSDKPSLASMMFPVLRRITLNACLNAGHLGPPIKAGLTVSFSTKGSCVPISCQVSFRATAVRSNRSSKVFCVLGSNMLSGCRWESPSASCLLTQHPKQPENVRFSLLGALVLALSFCCRSSCSNLPFMAQRNVASDTSTMDRVVSTQGITP